MCGASRRSQNNYDLSSNRYDPSWKNHPNMKGDNQQHEQPYVCWYRAAKCLSVWTKTKRGVNWF